MLETFKEMYVTLKQSSQVSEKCSWYLKKLFVKCTEYLHSTKNGFYYSNNVFVCTYKCLTRILEIYWKLVFIKHCKHLYENVKRI